MKLLLCVALSLAIPGICAGQSASPSEQTLQAILSELRAIHADMRVETARTQSMELLLAELQVQAATVTRAVQRVDAARSKRVMCKRAFDAQWRMSQELRRPEKRRPPRRKRADSRAIWID